MEFKFKIKVGETEIEINESANNNREFFEKISFFSGLPTKGENGSTDLKIVYRKTKGGDEFYSIVSESEKREYKFGIHKNSEKSLFPKGWEPLFERGGNDDSQESNPAPAQQTPRPALGANRPSLPKVAAAQPQQESQESEPEVQESIPTPAAAAPKPALPKVPAAPSAPAKPAGAPSSAANSILNKYLKK